MTSAKVARLARWRALLGLLWRTGPGRVTGFGLLVLVVGLLPTGLVLVTGALVRAIPAAVEGGLGSPAGRPALLALFGLVSGMAVLALGTSALTHLSRLLDSALGLEVHQAVAAVTLGTPGLAPLEDPALADGLQAVQDAERRGVLRRTVAALSNVAITRLRGMGAFVVLLGFHWWAPLLLAAAWHLTNRVYLRATENGVSFHMSDGAVRMRRAEYVRSLALEPPAAKEVRVFGLGGWLVGRYADAWTDALRMLWESRRVNRGLTVATGLALAVSHAVVLGALGRAASRGELEVAALLVFVQAVIATSDLGMIGDWQWFLGQSLGVAERVTGARARAAVPPAPAEPARPRSRGSGGMAVRLDGVRFTYRGREQPTLDGLTLEVPAGQSLAIVGENGAGKSTLIKLLCGLYEPDAGSVTLDGSASPLQARGYIGVIFQDFVRYPLPLRENVGFGCLPLMSDPRALEGALRDAGGGELPARLPKGWDTPLSREFEGGADLSGGQWQRVALARALLAVRAGAGLLILDEPTAALDVRAETELFERFLAVTRGVTTILVSHRLSSVRRADRIVVIDGGGVAEDGTHEGLVRAGGLYARMYSLQARRFALAQHAHGGAEEVPGA
ncbi:MAG TPA: ATP-binding cassette domain-containing protein [Longimicrobiaceae bacterium]|nr:ATP-binding cassette domain-containing protein [Longimicrobiaceae bacterium]